MQRPDGGDGCGAVGLSQNVRNRPSTRGNDDAVKRMPYPTKPYKLTPFHAPVQAALTHDGIIGGRIRGWVMGEIVSFPQKKNLNSLNTEYFSFCVFFFLCIIT
jgi:hypothetical protein